MPVLIIVIPLIIRHIVAVTLVAGLTQHHRLLMVLTRVHTLVRGKLLLLTFAVVILVAKSSVVGSIFRVALGGGGEMRMDATARIRLDCAQSSAVPLAVCRVILDQNILLEEHLGQLARLDLIWDRFLRVEGADFEAAHLS